MTTLFSYHKLCVDDNENNAILSNLLQEQMEITELYNTINRKVVYKNNSISKELLWKNNQKEFDNDMNELQAMMILWETKALEFIRIPNICITSDDVYDSNSEQRLQDHIIQFVAIMRNDMIIAREVITTNIGKFKNHIETVLNFSIAIGSFLLALIGLIIAIFMSIE